MSSHPAPKPRPLADFALGSPFVVMAAAATFTLALVGIVIVTR